MQSKKRKKRQHTRFRRPPFGRLVAGGFLALIAAFVVLLIVYGDWGEREDGDFNPEIVETRSESYGGEPFSGGPRLHFPVDSIDMGHVPLNTNVSYAFTMMNTGDAAVQIEDVKVSVLDGC